MVNSLLLKYKIHTYYCSGVILENEREKCTAWKVSIFGVFMVRIFPHLEWIRTRKTQNMDTFHTVLIPRFCQWMEIISLSFPSIMITTYLVTLRLSSWIQLLNTWYQWKCFYKSFVLKRFPSRYQRFFVSKYVHLLYLFWFMRD